MNSVELTLINQSNDQNNSTIVIFQKNAVNTNQSQIIAWKVIENLRLGWSHQINYNNPVDIGARDTWGNYAPLIPANPGQSFEMFTDPSGDVLKFSRDSSTSPMNIQFQNKLASAKIDALIFRDGKLLASVNGLAPEKSTDFKFESEIYIGVVSEVTEGSILDSAIVDSITTKLSLKGIEAANIIKSGGGTGPNAKPISFELVPTEI